jgi:hypothetical protein
MQKCALGGSSAPQCVHLTAKAAPQYRQKLALDGFSVWQTEQFILYT